MGSMIELKSADGTQVPAYEARPAGTPKGAVVVVQEIFGVNSHICAVADGYAAEGYLAVAPAAFHRVKPGVELGCSLHFVRPERGGALLRWWRDHRSRNRPPAWRAGHGALCPRRPLDSDGHGRDFQKRPCFGSGVHLCRTPRLQLRPARLMACALGPVGARAHAGVFQAALGLISRIKRPCAPFNGRRSNVRRRGQSKSARHRRLRA
jgi:hypothetical protein